MISSAIPSSQGRRRRRANGVLVGHLPVAVSLSWAFVLLLWLFRVIRAPASVVFLLAVSAAAVMVVAACVGLARDQPPLRALRRVALTLVVVSVPVAFSLAVVDPFNLVKHTILVVGAVVAGTALTMDLVRGQRVVWRSGLEWPVAALLAWLTVATMFGVSPRVSVLGAYASRDGLALALALGLLAVCVVASFDAADIRRLLQLIWFGAGGLAALYGGMQLHDRLTDLGGRWDWIRWNETNFPVVSIWSTLGNPNHLAGFFAILIPIGVALVVTAASRRERLLTGALAVVLLPELLHTGTIGAWLAALVGVTVTAGMLGPELRGRGRAGLLAGVAMLVFVGIAAVTLGGSRDLGHELTSVFDLSGASTANQRLSYWKGAVDMALDRPLVGVGPDAYELRFPQYQHREYVRANGATTAVNGPHNVVLAQLAAGGFPVAAAFLVLVVVAGLRAVGAWRRLRAAERGRSSPDARTNRYLLAGVTGALVAYLIQGSFNVQQVTLSLLFWVLLGMLAVLALAAGVPGSLRPSRLLSISLANEVPRSVARPRARTSATLALAGSVVVGLAGVGAIALAVLPYLADGRYRTAGRWQATAERFKQNPAAVRVALGRASDQLSEAIHLYPWEPAYARSLAQVSRRLSDSTIRDPRRPASPLDLLHRARSEYERALRLQPGSYRLLNQYAEVLTRIGEVDPGDRGAKPRAFSALREGIRANPWQAESRAMLAALLAKEGRTVEAMRVVEQGLARLPESVDLLRQGARLREKVGDSAAADLLWHRLLLVAPTDVEGLEAVGP